VTGSLITEMNKIGKSALMGYSREISFTLERFEFPRDIYILGLGV
jgi:hypothetical protein